MANIAVTPLDRPTLKASAGVRASVAVFFFAWLAVVLGLAARDAFTAAPGRPPLALLIGLLAPLGVFAFAYRAIPSVREFILSADPRVIVGIQGWRWAGFGFLSLYAFGVLPGIFAFPAGLGDMAIGVTAPLVLARLLRRADYASSRGFVMWNLAGILDLTVAVSIGALVPLFAPGLFGAATNSAMSRLPLVVIPTYLVPTFLMLHATALLQARRGRR